MKLEQAARLAGECPACGSACEGWAVQLVRDGKLAWDLDWEHAGCSASCDRSWGMAPDWVREAILSQHGPHLLKLTDADQRGGSLLKAFRTAFGLSIQEAQNAARVLRQDGYQGTPVEVSLLADLLRQNHIAVEIVPSPAAGARP